MADMPHDDQNKSSNPIDRKEERDTAPTSAPDVTAEEVKRDAEAEDRFEASDN